MVTATEERILTSRNTMDRICWAPPGPSFNPMIRGRKKTPALAMPGSSVDRPPLFVPDCDPDDKQTALDALAKMHAERPLRPPGR